MGGSVMLLTPSYLCGKSRTIVVGERSCAHSEGQGAIGIEVAVKLKFNCDLRVTDTNQLVSLCRKNVTPVIPDTSTF